LVSRSYPAAPRARRSNSKLFLQVLLVRKTGALRHEITKVVVEHKHAQLFCRFVGALDDVPGPLANDGAHDHEWKWKAELATEIEQAFETLYDSRVSTRATHPVMSRFVAIDRKDE